MSESQLIGGLLNEEEGHAPSAKDKPKLALSPSVAANVFSEDLIARPTSAPPIVSSFDAPQQPQQVPQYDVDSAEAFRSDPAYCKWYYSQNPRDPRLPPPIVRPQAHAPVPGAPGPGQPPIPGQPLGLGGFKKDEKDDGGSTLIAPTPWVPSMTPNTDPFGKVGGLVAMIQDDFPRTPSPVYGKEALTSAAMAANHAAALSLAGLNTPQPQQNPDQLAQAMQALNFQHTQQQVPPQNPPAQVPNQTPHPTTGQMQQMQPGVPMMPPVTYGGGMPTAPMSTMSTVPPPMGAPPQVGGVPQPGMQMQMQQPMNMGMQPSQFYPSQGYAPQMMPGYGMMPMAYGMEEQQQQGGYYNPSSFDQPPPPPQPPQQPPPLQSPAAEKPKKGSRRERGHEDVPRTRLMEEFRNKKAQRWELQDLVGHMVEFSRDQEGSRLIQRKLEGLQCTDNEKDMVFSEVFKEALGLMTDVFGNYVIQKLFEHGLPNHRKLLATVVKGNVLALTLQTYGCRVIQKALEVIDEEDQTMVASELDGHVLRCVLDQNGNHVIQKCIERIPPQNVTFIVQSFIGNVQNLAVHAYGCRVIQRILEYCEDHYEVISPILDEILDNVHILARDQYGNYVVQHVLINGKELYQCAIIERLRNDSLELAQHKFASNVVEKMFHYGSHEDKTIILADLLRINADGTSALHVMMKDQYANYVVQKIIDLADDAQRRQIIDHIKPHIATLRRYTYGKHIIARIEKLHTMNKAAPNQ